MVTPTSKGYWETRVRCGTCLWPILVRFDVTFPDSSILTVVHELEHSSQAMGCDWRLLGQDELQRLLRGVINEVCIKTTCMEYGGQHVRMDGTLVGDTHSRGGTHDRAS